MRSRATRALVLAIVLIPALSLAACGQSAQDKAKNQVWDAQPQLNAERKQQVQSANQAFRTELDSVVSNIGQNLSISNAQARLKSAVQQLAQSYQQTFATISCS